MTAEVTKFTRSNQRDLIFNFTQLSETLDSFARIRFALEIKNVANSIKPCS